MSWIRRVTDVAMATLGTGAESTFARIPPGVEPEHIANYRLYEDLYSNHFDEIAEELRRFGHLPDSMRGTRNPAHAVVEYYVATVWPKGVREAFPIEWPAEFGEEHRERLDINIRRIWRDSNWATRKNLMIRQQVKLGDIIIKVATNQTEDRKPTRVFFRLIHPMHVTDFDVDDRDYLTYIRLDIPTMRRNEDGKLEERGEIEIWDKRTGRVRIWDVGPERLYLDIDALGPPTDDADMESYGVDFLPFVWSKARDNHGERGVSVLAPAVPKVIEIEKSATRLNDLLFRFNKPTKVISSDHMDSNNKPMRPPPLPRDHKELERDLYDERVIALPSGWTVASLIDNLPYIAHLETIKDAIVDLRLTDFPELTYNRLSDAGRDLSGRALRYMLTAAIAKTEEVRANVDAALIRANQMALTIAGKHGLLVDASGLPFRSDNPLGTYESGAFEHWFGEREVVPLTEDERAEIEEMRSRTALNRLAYGWSRRALLKADGLDDAEIDAMLAELPALELGGDILDAPGNQQANELFEEAMARGE